MQSLENEGGLMRVEFRGLMIIVFTASLLIGCGLTNDQISETVKTSMQHSFDSDAQFKEYHLTVSKVQVVNESGNKYRGIATVIYDQESHNVPVEITADGTNVLWQTQQGAFLFIAQKSLQKLQKLWQQ
jgi:hypothetical protein